MALAQYSKPLSPEDAAHFIRRTSFGGTAGQIGLLVGKQAKEVAEQALGASNNSFVSNPFDPTTGSSLGASLQLLRASWIYEMIYGQNPLREKLALMWSNHFVVGTDKVRNYPALQQYLGILRKHSATSSFEAFAQEVAMSPAMLRYLDNDMNKKGKPNENFSRELLEIFTTGIGNYTEQDVQEGARALSGWTFIGGRNNKNYLEVPVFVYQKSQHDSGSKTYLGAKGNFEPQDIVKLAATHPATATRISTKLHKAFVSDTPDEKSVQGSAETFIRTNGSVMTVLLELLSSEVFFQSKKSIIRSPIDYIVGAIRTLGQPKLEEKEVIKLSQASAKMGQLLLYPDTVKGWDGGREWINDTSLLLRMQLAASLSLGNKAPKLDAIPSTLALTGSEKSSLGEFYSKLSPQQIVYLALISPEFQLL